MKKFHRFFVRFAVFVLAITLSISYMQVDALRETKTIEDDFEEKKNVGSYNQEIWNQYGEIGTILTEELVTPGKALQFKGTNISAESTVLMTDWYYQIQSFSFDIKIPADAEWFGLDFVDIETPDKYCGDYSKYGKPMCYGSLMISPKTILGFSTTWSKCGFSSDKLSDQWVSIKFVVTSANEAQVYITPRGINPDKSTPFKATLSGERSFYNSAVVFADYMFSGYIVDNIVINTDTGTFNEDFEDGKNDLLEVVSILNNKDKFSFPIIEVDGSRKIAFNSAAPQDRLISNTKIEAQDKNLNGKELVLSAQYSLYYPGKAKGEIAYVFGLQETDSDPFSQSWAYIVAKDKGRLVKFDENGKESVKKTNTFSSENRSIKISLIKNGLLTVSYDGKEVISFQGVDCYSGYTGFAAKTNISNSLYLDDVLITNQVYHVITTKTFSDDFSTNRLGTSGNSDYSHPASEVISVSDGELKYDGAEDSCPFGPVYEYETYEMTFKLTSILATDNVAETNSATSNDHWIGIDFGKKNSALKTYGSYGMVLMRVTSPKDVSADKWENAGVGLYKKSGTSTLKGEKFVKVKPIPASLFKDITYDGKTSQRASISADAAVCFKVEALSDCLNIYMKRADQKDYTLYVTVNNVNPAGYVALACTGFTFWTIDDFAIKNTAAIYTEAPDVVIEEVKLKSLAERGLGVEDNGYAEEQKLNAGSSNVNYVIWLIAGGAILVVSALGAVLLISYKKKRHATSEGGVNQL